MKKKFNIKSKLAGMLAAAMVFTMAVPNIPVYAIERGDPSVIEFNPVNGPDLSHSSYVRVPRHENGISFATGSAGYPLTNSGDFNGIPTDDFGSGPRPKLPQFEVDWAGYSFDGWYNEAGNKILNLPFAFPYTSTTTYKAVWKGNSTTPFTFTVMHYRDLDATRNANNNGKDVNAWPGEGDTNYYKFFESSDWTRSVMANTPVSATYRRDVPGYKLSTVLIKNNQIRKYGEDSGEGTMAGGAEINPTTNAVRGSMPNDNLTVAYRYAPDPTKKFAVHVEYVDPSGTQIKPSDTYTYSAEADVRISPSAIDAYTLQNGEIKEGAGGADDLSGRGIYSAQTANYEFDSSHVFTGKMPNQPITITYTYQIDPTFKTMLHVKRLDNHGEILAAEEVREVSPADPVVINVDNYDGYEYPPNMVWDEHLTSNPNSFDPVTKKLTLTTDMQGGTVTLTYNEKLSDDRYWSKIEYYNGSRGTISGDTSPRFVRLGDYTLDELVEGLTPSPEFGYMFNGWYMANAAGNDKTGNKLEGTISVSQPVRLFADFVEDPSKWFDLTFQSGSHGSITGLRTLHVKKDTLWTALSLPSAQPDANYIFLGWFDEAGNQVQNTQQILADQTYTARFVPTSLTDDGILAMPDAAGSIDGTGRGKITVSGANEDRKYVLTDSDHRVVAVKTGLQMKNSAFTELSPCTVYEIYEVSKDAVPVVGEVLSECVDAVYTGPPTQVLVPALGSNYQVGSTAGGMQVTVNPAAPGTHYAVLTLDGEVVNIVGADADGWILAGGSPLQAKLQPLEAGQVYVIVAGQPGDGIAPDEKLIMGTQVAVLDNSHTEEQYTIKLTNGGYIDEIISDGTALDTEEGQTTAVVKKGDTVKINAETVNDSGRPFSQWNILIGNPSMNASRRNQPITMPAGDVVLQAAYADSSVTGGRVTVDYSPKDGNTALDLSDEKLDDLKDTLTDNTSDHDVLSDGIDVAYTVKFNRRPPKASESNAVRAELGEDEEIARIPWALTSSLTRQVGGVNKELPADGNSTPPVRIYTKLDSSLQGFMNYQLWKVEGDEDSYLCTEVPMEPDLDDADIQFTGTMAFEGSVGSTYVLTYLKAHKVIIIDEKLGATYQVKVKTGTALDDAEDYQDIDMPEDYTDPVTGIVYENQGLGKTASSSAAYDTSLPVTKSMTLYVRYQAEDDTEWRKALKKLKDEIAVAQALSSNTSVSEEDRQRLHDAVAIALEVAGRPYRPSIEELTDAYDTLKELVDSISTGGEGPDEPDEPDEPDDPDNPSGGGGTGGGGGGTGGGGSGSGGGPGGGSSQKFGPGYTFNRYKSYYNGTEGQWESLDKNGSAWAFVLKSGNRVKSQWVNIRYHDSQNTYTYHFNQDGMMDYGWYKDTAGQWYYLDSRNGSEFGHLILGWYLDGDQNWYYFNQFTGSMLTGWQNVGDDWYYLNPDSQAGRPFGALYRGERTPDGYPVDENGKWMRETP